jgi:hypothetical protein
MTNPCASNIIEWENGETPVNQFVDLLVQEKTTNVNSFTLSESVTDSDYYCDSVTCTLREDES